MLQDNIDSVEIHLMEKWNFSEMVGFCSNLGYFFLGLI